MCIEPCHITVLVRQRFVFQQWVSNQAPAIVTLLCFRLGWALHQKCMTAHKASAGNSENEVHPVTTPARNQNVCCKMCSTYCTAVRFLHCVVSKQTSNKLCFLACFHRSQSQQLPSVAESILSRSPSLLFLMAQAAEHSLPKSRRKQPLHCQTDSAPTSTSKEQKGTAMPSWLWMTTMAWNVFKRYNPSSFSTAETFPSWDVLEQ